MFHYFDGYVQQLYNKLPEAIPVHRHQFGVFFFRPTKIPVRQQERGLPTNGKRFTLAERLSAALQGQAPLSNGNFGNGQPVDSKKVDIPQ